MDHYSNLLFIIDAMLRALDKFSGEITEIGPDLSAAAWPCCLAPAGLQREFTQS